MDNPESAPNSPSSPKSRMTILVGLALAGVLVVAGLFFVLSSSDSSSDAGSDQDDEVASSDNSDAESSVEGGSVIGSGLEPQDGGESGNANAPELAGSEDHAECPADLAADLCELAAFVEDARGRPFQFFPVIELQANDQFDAGLLADFDEDSGDLEVAGDVMRSVGLIDPDDDLVALIRETLEIGVVGYYDPETKGLVVRGSEFDLFSKLVLVHELTHAHDDQWIGLDRPELEERDDEQEFGFSALVEGNASRVEDLWRSSLSTDDQRELGELEQSVLSADELDRYLAIPIFVLLVQASPYTDGLTLVEAIYEDGGEQAVTEAFENAPRTSELVLHPEKYLAGEAVELQPKPPAPQPEIDSGVFGELSIRHWLGYDAGEGWGSDAYVTWRDGDKACTRIDITADSNRDAEELAAAATIWSREAPDRTVEVVDGLLRVTGCA